MFMQNNGSITTAATESGDVTLVRPSTFDRLMSPPAANDNGNLPHVVGLMGYGGSGKSEVAKVLATTGYARLHVKAPLRAMAAALLGCAGYSPAETDDWLDGSLKRTRIPELRRSGTEIQQELGTSFGREFCHPNLWLDLWLANATRILGDGGKVVQESVRFANEVAAIRELGGTVVRVDRIGVGPLSDHISETLPAVPDFVIHNNGSLLDLRWQVMAWLRHAA